MRFALALLLAASAAAAEPARGPVQAAEFPYYAYPRHLWERELVWLKTVGVRTVAFSIPWNWHQPEPGEPDFTGRTSPRRDLVSFVATLRRLGLEAWVRPLPPVENWLAGGLPGWAAQDRRAARAWQRQLERLLEPHTRPHGGPIAWAEGAPGFLGLPAPPAPVTELSAADSGALARSRAALASGRGSLLWRDVENTLYPAGWQPPGTGPLRRGAIGFDGEEAASAAALRRDAALLKNWAPLIGRMRPPPKPAARPVTGKLPAGVAAQQLVSRQASAVSVVNRSPKPWRGDLLVWDPVSAREITVPGVEVPAGESLWLPVAVSLAGGGLCRDCAGLAAPERIVYATAELQSIEYENGLLAMEFSAPVAADVVLQLAREPSGPFLAAGSVDHFDFDPKTMRTHLHVPAGKGPGHRVRIGLAIEPPDASAFFVDARRLVVGRKNVVRTSYSSAELAQRSRLRLPEGWSASPTASSPTEIDYEIDVPADAAHGDWVNLAIEADGVLLGRARLQLFRPASIRLAQAMRMHFGQQELPVEPAVAAIDARAGRNLDLSILNNTTGIRNYTVEASGAGFQFLPPKSEISVGATAARSVAIRTFADDGREGLNDVRLRVSGGAEADMPVRLVVIPRGGAAAWHADLDGDGYPEWVLENQRVRAVFSGQDGGRWLSFVWKDTGVNLLPESGAYAAVGPAVVRVADGPKLEIVTSAGARSVSLDGTSLVIEQAAPLPAAALRNTAREGVALEVRRESPGRTVHTLRAEEARPPGANAVR